MMLDKVYEAFLRDSWQTFSQGLGVIENESNIYMFVGRQKKYPTEHASLVTELLYVPNIPNTETEQAATRPMAP